MLQLYWLLNCAPAEENGNHRRRPLQNHGRVGRGGRAKRLLALAGVKMGVGGQTMPQMSAGGVREMSAITLPPRDVLGLKEQIIIDWWSPADDPSGLQTLAGLGRNLFIYLFIYWQETLAHWRVTQITQICLHLVRNQS